VKSIAEYWGGKRQACESPVHAFPAYLGRMCSSIGPDGSFVGNANDSDSIDNHHGPAALSHFYQLQQLVDSGDEMRFIFESDGFEHTTVNFADYNDLVAALPADFDFVLMMNTFERGELINTFKGSSTSTQYELHRWRDGSEAGIGYLASRAGAQKLLLYASTHGYGLIDLWITGNACSGDDTQLDKDKLDVTGEVTFVQRSEERALVCYNVYPSGSGIAAPAALGGTGHAKGHVPIAPAVEAALFPGSATASMGAAKRPIKAKKGHTTHEGVEPSWG